MTTSAPGNTDGLGGESPMTARCRALEKQLAIMQDRLSEQARIFGERPAWPNGHFYSPLPSRAEILADGNARRIWPAWPRTLPDVDVREDEQMKVRRDMAPYYASLPFRDERADGLRYRYDNHTYSYTDAIFLNGMIRRTRPKRIIEIGSGNSSAMMLDTNERWFDNAIECTFIEPEPRLLESNLKPGDLDRITIHPRRLQDVPREIFATLEEGDILFIDSTHVSKVGGDVNCIFFEILPRIRSGVTLHFHDIFYPFEYPMQWIREGYAWNEIYLLRAFLQHNNAYEIVLFNNFIVHFQRSYFEANMPLCLKNAGGSLWLRKR